VRAALSGEKGSMMLLISILIHAMMQQATPAVAEGQFSSRFAQFSRVLYVSWLKAVVVTRQ
jgi:hypothetical protein